MELPLEKLRGTDLAPLYMIVPMMVGMATCYAVLPVWLLYRALRVAVMWGWLG